MANGAFSSTVLIDNVKKSVAPARGHFHRRPPELTQLLQTLAPIACTSRQTRALSRGDVVALLDVAHTQLAKLYEIKTDTCWSGFCVNGIGVVLDAFFVALPAAIRDAPGTTRGGRARRSDAGDADGDAPGRSRPARRVPSAHRRRGRARAVLDDGAMGTPRRCPPERGARRGWRLQPHPRSGGAHVAVSGLVYKLSIQGAAQDRIMFLAGVSVNAYRLLD